MTALPETPTWLYLKVYPGRLDLIDATLRTVVRPWVAAHTSVIRRWFYLRYFDGAGPHVRLRLLLGHDDADALALAVPELLDRLGSLEADDRARRSDVPGLPGRAHHHAAKQFRAEVAVDLYEPEYGKWGGVEFMPVAETLFEFSSTISAVFLDLMPAGWRGRLAIASAIIRGTVRSLQLGRADERSFLAAHFAWWSGEHGGGPTEDVDTLREIAAREGHDVVVLMLTLTSDDVFVGSLEDFTTQLAGVLARSNPSQQRLFLVFHHLHLMLNRLGVIPSEEALASLIAAHVLEFGDVVDACA